MYPVCIVEVTCHSLQYKKKIVLVEQQCIFVRILRICSYGRTDDILYYDYTIHWPFQSCYMAAKLGLLKQVMPEE